VICLPRGNAQECGRSRQQFFNTDANANSNRDTFTQSYSNTYRDLNSYSDANRNVNANRV
jgi:hypothetical protein